MKKTIFMVDVLPNNYFINNEGFQLSVENCIEQKCVDQARKLAKQQGFEFKIFHCYDPEVQECQQRLINLYLKYFAIDDYRKACMLWSDIVRLYILSKHRNYMYIDTDIYLSDDFNAKAFFKKRFNIKASYCVLVNNSLFKGKYYENLLKQIILRAIKIKRPEVLVSELWDYVFLALEKRKRDLKDDWHGFEKDGIFHLTLGELPKKKQFMNQFKNNLIKPAEITQTKYYYYSDSFDRNNTLPGPYYYLVINTVDYYQQQLAPFPNFFPVEVYGTVEKTVEMLERFSGKKLIHV